MQTTTQTEDSQILANLQANKELQKNMKKLNYYSNEQFLNDARRYIKAIQERRMINNIVSVSNSGMSKVIKFLSCEQSARLDSFNYLNYCCFFISLGFTEVKGRGEFRINGCGMDMIFHTNYSIIHSLKNLGIIDKEQCEVLAQMTPSTI